MVPAILTVWYPLLDTFYERSTRYPLHCAHFVCLSSQYPLSSTFYKVPFPVLQSTGNPLHGIICMVTFATWYPLYATLPGTFYTRSYLYRVLFALYPRHATFHTVNFKLHLLQGTFYFSISFCWFFRVPHPNTTLKTTFSVMFSAMWFTVGKLTAMIMFASCQCLLYMKNFWVDHIRTRLVACHNYNKNVVLQ